MQFGASIHANAASSVSVNEIEAMAANIAMDWRWNALDDVWAQRLTMCHCSLIQLLVICARQAQQAQLCNYCSN